MEGAGAYGSWSSRLALRVTLLDWGDGPIAPCAFDRHPLSVHNTLQRRFTKKGCLSRRRRGEDTYIANGRRTENDLGDGERSRAISKRQYGKGWRRRRQR